MEKNRFLNRKSTRICLKKNVIKLDKVCKNPRKTEKLEPLKDIVWQNQKKGQNSLKYTKSSEKDISQGSKISTKSQRPAKCKKLVEKDFFVKSQKKKKESHSISHHSPEKAMVRKSPRKLLSKTKSTFECPCCNAEQGCNQRISNVVKLKNIESKVQRERVTGKGGSKVQREPVLGKGDKSYYLRRGISHVHNLKDTLKNNSFTSLKKGKTKTLKIKVDSSKKSSERTNKTIVCDNLRKSPRKVAQNGSNRPQDSPDRSPKFGNNSRQLFPRQHKSCKKENNDQVKLQKRLPRKQEGRNNKSSTNKDKNLEKKTKERRTDKELVKVKLFVSAFRNRKKNQKMKLDKTVQGSSTNTKVNKTESESGNMDESYDKNYHSTVACNFKTPEKTTETNATVTSEISRISSQGKHTTPKKRWQALFESEVSDYNSANFSGFIEIKKSDTTDMTKTDGKLYNETDKNSYPSDIDVVTIQYSMHDDFVKNKQMISSTMCDRQIRNKTHHHVKEESHYEDSLLSLTCARFRPYYRVCNSARTLPIGEQC